MTTETTIENTITIETAAVDPVAVAQSLIDARADLREHVRRVGAAAWGSYYARTTRFAVRVVAGSAAPAVYGERGYWTTPSGRTRVLYPSAYKWPTVYHCSTMRVEVGAGWLRRARPLSFAAVGAVGAV